MPDAWGSEPRGQAWSDSARLCWWTGLAVGRRRAAAVKLVGWRCSGYIPYESDAALTAWVMSQQGPKNLWGQSLCFLGVYI